jgi:hypothetical protein
VPGSSGEHGGAHLGRRAGILASTEKTYDVRIPDEQLVHMTTVDAIAGFIEKSRAAPG